MKEQVAQLLLQEFRNFRDNEFRQFREELSAWREDAGEKIATLESDVKAGIKGNGQPSRLAAVEHRLGALERLKWRVTGAAVTVWAIVEAVLHVKIAR